MINAIQSGHISRFLFYFNGGYNIVRCFVHQLRILFQIAMCCITSMVVFGNIVTIVEFRTS